jgi:hypothetical protein
MTVVIAAIIGALGDQSLAVSSSSAASPIDNAIITRGEKA